MVKCQDTISRTQADAVYYVLLKISLKVEVILHTCNHVHKTI